MLLLALLNDEATVTDAVQQCDASSSPRFLRVDACTAQPQLTSNAVGLLLPSYNLDNPCP